MNSILKNISPFNYLNLAIDQDGGMGYLFSPVGSGKTQLLTHLGLYYTLQSHIVLHISLSQTIQKLREMYEQSFFDLLTIAEVEELVPAGELDPNHIHTPGIFVQRIYQGAKFEKRIEQLTTRKRD